MDSVALIRLKTGDKSAITREVSTGDGTSLYFKLGQNNVINDPDIEVRLDNVLTSAYTVNYAAGVVTFNSAPALGVKVEFTYYWAVYTDAEIQAFIDEASGDTTIASAKVLLAMASDAARLARRTTLSGGGGMGSTTIDTSVAAKELRASAEALIKMQGLVGDNAEPVDQLTEPIWTTFDFEFQVGQHVIRNS